MLAYLIAAAVIFLLGAISNILFLSSPDTENKPSAAIGLTLYISMICWTIAIIADQ
jgi:hypothetical protein